MNKSRVLLVRQYPPAGAPLPVGTCPRAESIKGETPLKAAKRELREETGYRAKKWTKLASFYVESGLPGREDDDLPGRTLKKGEAKPMEDERIETSWFPAKQVGEMIESGKIQDAKTMIGYHRWRSRR